MSVKNPIKPTTFWLAAQCLNHLHQCMPPTWNTNVKSILFYKILIQDSTPSNVYQKVVSFISANGTCIFTVPNDRPKRPKHIAMTTKGAAVVLSTCVLGYYLPHCKYARTNTAAVLDIYSYCLRVLITPPPPIRH
jgi:hypothetical protein